MSEAPRAATIDQSLVSGLAWNGVLRWVSQLVSWAATFYAARLLTPGDFGLLAMAMLAIGLARMVQEFGLDAILVQDRSIVGQQEARLAGLLVGFGAFLCALYILLSPLLAAFFDEPRVTMIVAALSVLFVFDSIQIVPYARLQRALQFRRLAIVMFVQVAVSAAAIVGAVHLGLGVWSLVINHLAGEFAVTVLLLYWAPYAIAWPREIARLAGPLLQGWRMLFSRIVWYGYSNADQTIIGKMLGKDLLGAYSFAQTFSTLAQREIGSVVSKVVPGIFSEVQNQPAELKRYFLLLTEVSTVLSFPVAIGFALVADMAVPLFLGDHWNAAIAPAIWLCLRSAFLATQLLVPHVLLWTGQFRLNMWLAILAGVTIPLALLAGARFGLEGVAIAWALADPVISIPAFYFAFRTVKASVWEWAGSFRPAAVASLLMVLCVMALRQLLPDSISLTAECWISIATGAVVYPAALCVLFPNRVRNLVQFAKSLRRSHVPQ